MEAGYENTRSRFVQGGGHQLSNCTSIWPSFYIVGAAKAGTSSLYEALRLHPEVFFPWIKEPNYFLSVAPPPLKLEGISSHCYNNPEAYQELYKDAGNYRATGDASVTYLWDEDAPRRIFQVRPDARILIILRDPIERAYSHYLMLRTLRLEPESSFLKALQVSQRRDKSYIWTGTLYVEVGLYFEQVKRYLTTFGSEQVLVLLTEHLNENPKETMLRVTQHLGIGPITADDRELGAARNAFGSPRFPGLYQFASRRLISPDLRRKYLPLGVREWLRASSLLYSHRKPQMDKESRRFLQKIYEPDVARLEQLLGYDLSALRRSWDKQRGA